MQRENTDEDNVRVHLGVLSIHNIQMYDGHISIPQGIYTHLILV